MNKSKNKKLKIKTTYQKYENIFSFLVCVFHFLSLIFYFSLQGCGGGAIVEQLPTPPPELPAGSLNLSPQEEVFVAASSFTDPFGGIATVGLNNPHPVQAGKLVTDSSDVVIRSFENKLFVINRGVTSTIQVVDPESFKVIGNYSVGAGSNPQDLVVTNGKAFITRLDAHRAEENKDDLWIAEPITGTLITSIDFKPFTTDDGDRLARATQMALVGDLLYCVLQDLSKNFEVTTNGKVIVIDTKTNEVLQTIQLAGRNPWDIVYSESLNRLFVTNMDFKNGIGSPYGGIEVIDVAKNESLGILMDDTSFGGYTSILRLLSNRFGILTVNAATIATFDPTNLTILNSSLYTTQGPFIPDLLIDKNGLLWVPERNPNQAGVLLLDPQTGAAIAGPLEVGSYPTSMTLIK